MKGTLVLESAGEEAHTKADIVVGIRRPVVVTIRNAEVVGIVIVPRPAAQNPTLLPLPPLDLGEQCLPVQAFLSCKCRRVSHALSTTSQTDQRFSSEQFFVTALLKNISFGA